MENRENKYQFSIPYFTEFKNFDAFLEEHGYLDDLIIKPNDITKMTVKEAGTGKTAEVANKK